MARPGWPSGGRRRAGAIIGHEPTASYLRKQTSMRILSEFERRLEGAIESIFSKAFGGGVQPVELVVVSGDVEGKRYALEQEVTSIGRLPSSEVLLSDPGASRRHAEVRLHDGRYVIADLGSTNGTMVNEASVAERELRDGDRI